MREVGRYTLLTKLGGGGMADVHLAARDRSTDPKDLVALKVPKEEVAGNPEFVDMFLDEARLAARLDHPNIVKTFEVGEADGTQFIAMEFLDGHSMSRIIQNIPDLPLAMHLTFIAEVLQGIDYAHTLKDEKGNPLNVIHRDLTPQNVVVTHDGLVKILDFGIARAEGRASQTVAGQFKGKVTYMSPEQARGRELDRRADLFAIGVMLFEACIGERMWKGVKEVDVLTTLLGRRHPRNPQMINPEVHDDLDAICHRALSVIDHRYQTATEMLKDLEEHLAENVQQPTREQISELLKTRFTEKRAIVEARIDAKLKALAAENAQRSKPKPPPVPQKKTEKGPASDSLPPMRPQASSSPLLEVYAPAGDHHPSRTSTSLPITPEVAEAMERARQSSPSIPDQAPSSTAPEVVEDVDTEAAASRQHMIKMGVMIVAAAIVASLLTLLVQKLF